MVRVRFWQDRQGHYRGFVADGHAGWAVAGRDIVCAAVSALTQATVVGLEQVARLPIEREQDDSRGFLSCRWQPSRSWAVAQWQAADLLCETLWRALQEIAQQYPEHVRIAKVAVG